MGTISLLASPIRSVSAKPRVVRPVPPVFGGPSPVAAAGAQQTAASPGDSGTPWQGRRCGEPAAPLSFAARKEQQLVLLLARQLASAQFELAHGAMTQRLWVKNKTSSSE